MKDVLECSESCVNITNYRCHHINTQDIREEYRDILNHLLFRNARYHLKAPPTLRPPAINDVNGPVSVDLGVSKVLSHLRNKDHNLISSPAQDSGEEGQTHSLDSADEILLGPHAQFLELWVPGPSVDWPFEGSFHDVNKADVLEISLACITSGERVTGKVGGFQHQFGPFIQRRVF